MTGTARPAGALGENPVAALTEAVDALAEQRPSDLPGPVALERARALLAEAERVKTLALLALADVDTRELFTLDGLPTTTAWVDDQRVPGVTGAEVALARRLPAAPAVRDALVAGRLSAKAAREVALELAKARPFLDRADGRIDGRPGEPALAGVLVDGVTMLLAEQTGGADDPQAVRLRAELQAVVEGPGTQRERLETGLVLFAQRSDPGMLRSGLGLLRDALLPAEHEARARTVDERAEVRLDRDPLGRGWLLRGRLDDVTGERLAAALSAETATDLANLADTAAWQAAAADPALTDLPPAEWPDEQQRPRSRAERAHAALGALLDRTLDTGALGSRDKALPHLVVTVGLDYLNDLPGALPARGRFGAVLTRMQLRKMACGSMITRLVLSPGNRVIAASHTQRTATALERLILATEWAGRCAVDGCARGPSTGHRLVPHHADLFSRSQKTALADTRPLCEIDHHHLHDDRRVLRLRDGRWIGPDGWVEERVGA